MAGMELVGVAGVLDAFDEVEDAMTTTDRWVIGTNVRYAPYQEFGTSYQSGTPHLRPGFDEAVAGFNQRASAAGSVAAELQRTAFMVERMTKGFAPVDTGHLRASYRAEKF